MTWWQIALAAAVLALACAAAYLRGREAGERWKAPRAGEDDHSLFGRSVPVLDTERRLVETMPDALIVADANGVVRYNSPGAEALHLIERDRLAAGEIEEILALVSSDGRMREREMKVRLGRLPRRPGSGGRGVLAGETVPSDTLYLRVRVGRIADGLYAIFLRDMSEQRRFEAMRRDYVTNVSHELKTPAGAIALLSETVADAADDPDAVRYFSGRIAKESRRLTELVRRLIDLQRAQDAPSLHDAHPQPVVDLVREAIAANEVQADAGHIAVVLSFDGEPIPTAVPADAADEPARAVLVDVGREPFVTAVKNLVENAIHYSPEHTTISVGIAARADRVSIRVVDQGIGIPAGSLDRIFERFYRVDPARSRETGGSGLGLAITKHCVQECGGTISVWSREGEGSTFTVELPRARAGA
ncbi:sensor histidine kinase [Bifidobacterium phasiani]|uniref:Sensor-like histidine kinase SenX3 n=1 Tax=Bifidobacterium phasiani TaxID=2834431 RepID=A0ABS6WAV0_9BIFI|nr:ATP-binding protein [Bifidobacterium phasiani]MBW3083643.1 two-component sensor histidine kinase [Bifidobacterium phasiani]